MEGDEDSKALRSSARGLSDQEPESALDSTSLVCRSAQATSSLASAEDGTLPESVTRAAAAKGASDGTEALGWEEAPSPVSCCELVDAVAELCKLLR